MKITEQCVVALTWTLKDTLGEELDTLDEPVEFLVGGTDLLGKIEEMLQGHEPGDKVELQIEPQDAFGDYDKGAKPPPGMIAALFRKLKAFFAKLSQALRGAGFQSADDIFQAVERGELKPAGGLARDVVEVRRVATNDAAECDDAREAPRLREACCRKRQLERSGNDHDRDGLLPHAGRFELYERAARPGRGDADDAGVERGDLPMLGVSDLEPD